MDLKPHLQRLFDEVVAHARKQRRKSMSEDGKYCLYRGPDGCMCFMGPRIPDDQYQPWMDDLDLRDEDGCHIGEAISNLLAWGHLDLGFAYEKMEYGGRKTLERFLVSLQVIHDRSEVEAWDAKFADYAREWGLQYTPEPIQAAA